MTVATAESCTGGMVAQALTAVPGSSGYVVGGIVAYANAVKEELLGVPESMLAAHGAVSAQVAKAMAEGCRARLAAGAAVAVTGIAGPDGGTESKPVGLTYLAVSLAGRPTEVRRFVFGGGRAAVREAATAAAIELLLGTVGGRPGAGEA